VQFEFSQYCMQENEGALTVKVLRGTDVDLPPFTVDFATTNLNATAGQDYTETKGTLDFGVGETVQTITVPITYDEQREPDEKFSLFLSNPSAGVVLGKNGTATITILDTAGMVAHQFDRIAVLADQSVQLTLGGGVHTWFRSYFDLYPVEVSTSLVDWTPLVTLQRTNSSTNVFTYTDPNAAKSELRFYRTVASHLITPLRRPTGPFAVGMISRLVNDPTRRNRYGVSTNGSFMVSIWYPAVAEAAILPGRLIDEWMATNPTWLTVRLGGASLDRLPFLMSYALAGAACARNEALYPIVIFSPGGWGDRLDVMERGPDLASHGYVVVAVDPVDATATVFPDGTFLRGDSSLGLTDVGFADRVKDVRFVMDELERWNRSDPVFAGRLDVTNVATMGVSWGGGVAGEVARVDERCRAAIVLEGYFQNASDLVRLGLTKPSLSVYASPITLPGQENLMFNKTTHDAMWFQVSSTVHDNFFDWYWVYYLPAGREAARTINAYAVWFLNKYLKGLDDPMPARQDYPRVTNLKQK
jgi:dienelactone hydrolase